MPNRHATSHQERADRCEDALRQLDDAICNVSLIVQSLSETGNQMVADEWQKVQEQLHDCRIKATNLAR
jgi:hypothetical protein